MKNLYARLVLWLVAPALDLRPRPATGAIGSLTLLPATAGSIAAGRLGAGVRYARAGH